LFTGSSWSWFYTIMSPWNHVHKENFYLFFCSMITSII
jgi:hypothetical protein